MCVYSIHLQTDVYADLRHILEAIHLYQTSYFSSQRTTPGAAPIHASLRPLEHPNQDLEELLSSQLQVTEPSDANAKTEEMLRAHPQGLTTAEMKVMDPSCRDYERILEEVFISLSLFISFQVTHMGIH